jgi:iron(III) transport system substrate-binding protein
MKKLPWFLLAAVVTVLIITRIGMTRSSKLAWQEGWEKVIEAAKKEGIVSVWAPPGAWARQILVDEFHRGFRQIKVDYQGAAGSAAWPKFQAEREAGLFTVDVHIGGVGTAATALYKAKVQQPIQPAFILPEVKDKNAWWQGKFHFGDPEGKYVFIFSISPIPAIAYNTQLFDPKELRSYKDLLDPKWKGKIVMFDPRIGGPGNSRWHFFIEAMGREYVEALVKQLVLTRDFRQSVEWVATGKYPLGIGLSDVHVAEFIKKGAPIAQISCLAEGNYLSAGWGTVNFLDHAPHANAAKLYISWLLSKEGQLAWQKSGYNSARIDIPKDTVDSMNRIVDGVKYYEQFTARAVKQRDEVSTKLARDIIKD